MDWNWNGIGAVIAILISLGSLAVAYLSHRAARESADAAKRAVAIQEAEHLHSRRASLLIMGAHTQLNTDGGVITARPSPHFQFWLKNIGGSEAFDMRATLEAEPDLGLKLIRAAKKIGPSEQKAFGGKVARVRGQAPPKIYVATFRLSYQDVSGRHDLEASFDLSFDLVKRVTVEPTSVLLDGQSHFQDRATS